MTFFHSSKTSMLTFFSGDRKRVTICPGNIPILTEVVSAPLLATTDGDSSLLSDVVDSQSTLGVPSVAGIKPQKCPSPSKFRRSKLPSAIQRKIEHFRQHTGSLYGLALLAGGNVLFSFMAVLIKSAGKYLSSEETVFWRSTVALVLNVSIQLRLKIPPFTVAPEFRKLLLCRALVGYVAMTLSFYAYSTMILSEAQVIICSSPIVTFILSVCFLGEMLDRVDFACVLVSFVGVVCVARPASLFGDVATSSPFGTSFVSMLCAVLAACLIGVINILIRKLSALNTWTLVTYFLLACSVLSAAKITLFEQVCTIVCHCDDFMIRVGALDPNQRHTCADDSWHWCVGLCGSSDDHQRVSSREGWHWFGHDVCQHSVRHDMGRDALGRKPTRMECLWCCHYLHGGAHHRVPQIQEAIVR
ncbi:hypothetical protein H257_11496 [Aphanomyces astaci]|uniref:EamA domain-containing protein n=1 Tax=Aphanomyces astaci TaxID=112090 RepID=W4G2B5_APHAT|nr:hypothetical protein H257_11496 [Aphanomyces astaci]ETV73825.1 hypothetical protein H257_11496 [Aphanomyces astaci]|eukprot:XP_009836762.1 hypothetical protein H257_11496 [Aphanomyces astaci]